MRTEAQKRATQVYQQSSGYKELMKERRKTRQYKDMQNRYHQSAYSKNKTWYQERNLRPYGITLERYNEMLEEQNHACATCKTPTANLKRRLAVDHDHETGKVRGLLCNSCNTALGSAKDNQEILQNMIHYLQRQSD